MFVKPHPLHELKIGLYTKLVFILADDSFDLNLFR